MLYFLYMGHSQLVFLRKFILTQDSNDVLKGFVVLQDLLYPMDNIIMLNAKSVGSMMQ